MAQLFTNNGVTTLASGITDVATSLTVATGKGALFPAPTGGDYFLLTLTQATSETSWEVVKVTARTGDVMTVVRAQEGTTAAAWAAGDKAELRVTAETLNSLADDATVTAHTSNVSNPHTVTATQVGLGNVDNTSNATERAAVATLTNKTIEAGTFTNGYTEETVTANTSTAYTIDLANGSVQFLTLTGNCVYTFPTATAGKSFLLVQRQDATGSRTVTWPAAVAWPAATAPTLISTASKADVFAFTADGTNWYGRVIGQNYA